MKQKFTTMLLVTILVLGMGLVQAQDQSEIDKLLNQTKVLQEQLDSFKEKEFATLTGNADKFFLLVMGIVVFLMQCGFAFLEAGAVRSKNTVNILIKNMLDALIGGISYWAIGWGLAYGADGNAFCGGSEYFSFNMPHDNYPSWFFQFVFAATAATIVSGAIAERCNFSAYFAYSILITGWVYPPITHWGWDGDNGGFLGNMQFGGEEPYAYSDFAGSGIVHVTGGVCALVGCYFIGPRMGRFTKTGQPIDMPGHSVPLAGLGGFILLVGFLAFNGGSQLAISNEGDAAVVGLAIANTILGGATGGMSVLFINYKINGKWSYLQTLNGALAGMVSMCAGCNVYEPWAALLIGLVAGPVFFVIHNLMLKMRLDDPLDAVAVHMGGGTLGVIALPFFSQGTGIFWSQDGWTQLGVNLLGLLVIYVWAGFWSIAIFGSLWYFKQLRIGRDVEFKGNDMEKHGEAAYPRSAWLEFQYGNGPPPEPKLPPHMTHSPCSGRKVGKVADTLGSTTTNGSTKEGKQNPSFEA